MRGNLAAAAGLGLVLASACGGSTSGTSGTTGGVATTGGENTTGGAGTTGAATTGGASTTGGTTGLATTGGTTGAATTTGGSGGLANGAPCSGNSQCLSNVCGINGSGNCCMAMCLTTDATCGATSCDTGGDCVYPPDTTSCGTATCSGGMLTTSACDGSGRCTSGTSTACPNHLECNSGGTSCLTICTTSTDCATGFYCNGGACAALLADGAACTSNGSCSSAICGTIGAGNCCTAVCDTSDLTCGATGCDATGTCTYPPNTTSCGTATCTGGMLTTSACNGSGSCTPGTPTACPNHLECNGAGTACLTTCTMLSDCASGFWCNASTCTAQQATGACTENDACTSGVCGTGGTGNCCTMPCFTTDPICGATACDATSGACTYPPNSTSCGATTCSNSTLTTNDCNGTGTCVSNGVDCPDNFLCNAGGTACDTTCTDNTACAMGDFCDVGNQSCCSLANNGALSVDETTGNDSTACCGIGTNGACQTLTKAMALIDGAQVTGVTITATVNGEGGNWSTQNETYPVSLGWGVTLSAPGVYFGNSAYPEIFDIVLQTGEAAGNMVTIEGSGGLVPSPVVLGSDNLGNIAYNTSSITVEANETLNVSYVDVYEPLGYFGITVQSSGTLDIDENAVGGYLHLGGNLPNGTAITSSLGSGIDCIGTVSDANAAASPSVAGAGQDLSIYAEMSGSVTLVGNPTFGWPTSGGYTSAGQGCTGNPTPKDYTGVQAEGSATVILKNATVTCMSGSGIYVEGTPGPTVTLTNVTIENCAQDGIYTSGGTVTVNSGTIDHNFIGVNMSSNKNTGTPSVTLNDGTLTNNTTVICNSNQENGYPTSGIDVYNNSDGNVAADYVNWDQWSATNGADLFWCDQFLACTCEAASCTNTAGGDDMDLVMGGDGGAITGSETSTNGAKAPVACN
jgi:hypothetical protein